MRRFVLASQSPARLGVLRRAGIEPEVIVSGVDEDAISAPSTAELVAELARAKAAAVAPRVPDALVLGCDSLLDLAGRAQGKPASDAEATAWWRERRDAQGVLYTGHCLVDAASGKEIVAVDATVVRFGSPSDAEIAAYVASGEPGQVAGAFTIDGRGAWFVDAIEGDAGNVLGLSLPVLRRMLAEFGIDVTALWA